MESALPGVPVVDDGASGVGFSGVVVCIGEGVGSGVSGALLWRVPGVPSATRGV